MLCEIFKQRPDHRQYKESTFLSCNDTLVGVEIEVEGNVTNRFGKPFMYWNEVEDGSLRNGREFVTNGEGLAGADLVAAINEITAYLRTKDIVFSDRCSVHVHMDARKLTRQQVFNMAVLYAYFEELLMFVGGEWRSSNIFCQSFARSNLANSITALIESDSSTANTASRIGRYSSFNINSLSKHGTIEIRCHEGTSSKKRLLNWINMLLQLRAYAIKADLDKMYKAIFDGNMSTAEVFGKYAPMLEASPDVTAKLAVGRANVLDIYLNHQKLTKGAA